MLKDQSVTGLPAMEMKEFFCEACTMGKMTRKPFTDAERRDCLPGEFLHTDLCGPMEESSLGGSKYYALFKDEASAYRFLFPIKSKDQLYEKLQEVIREVKSITGRHVKRIRSDNATEYTNVRVQKLLLDKGIVHEFSAPYVHQQNGMIERDNRSIVNLVRSMLNARNLPKILWAEAAVTAVYLMNRVPNRDEKVTPYEMMYHRKPDVSHLRTFGCNAYPLIDESQRKKLDDRAERMIFVGYESTTKNFRLWDPEGKRVITAKHIDWNESDTHASVQKIPEIRRGPGRPRKDDQELQNDLRERGNQLQMHSQSGQMIPQLCARH
jgi:transposase InsO family protein